MGELLHGIVRNGRVTVETPLPEGKTCLVLWRPINAEDEEALRFFMASRGEAHEEIERVIQKVHELLPE